MSRALYRLLLRLLPSEFRRRHGADMEAVFVETLERVRRRGRLRVAALLAREAVDLARTGARLRTRGVGAPIRDDVRQAVRSLARRPTFTLFAAGTVALGVGATTAIFSALESVILNPLPYEGADRLVSLWRTLGDGQTMVVTPSEEQFQAWSRQEDLLEGVEPIQSRYPNLTGLGEGVRLSMGLVQPSFLPFLGVQPLLGRAFTEAETAGDGASVVLLGHHLWIERFGGEASALGRTVTLEGEPYTVIGVLPSRLPVPDGLPRRLDLLAPLPSTLGVRGATVVARLRRAATLEMVQQRMDMLAQRAEDEGGRAAEWAGKPRSVLETVRAPVADTLRVLMAAVVLLLLIACVNVSNLLLSRATRRQREIAVRSALGAGRWRLFREQLLESLVLGLTGGAVGVALARLAVGAMRSLQAEGPLEVLGSVHLNGRVLLFAVAASVLAAVLFGTLPAVTASSTRPARGLSGARGAPGPGRRDVRARWFLLSAEVALSFALLVGAGLVLRSLADLRSNDPGFRAEGLVALRVSLPTWKYQDQNGWEPVYQEILEAVRRLPGVVEVVQSSGVPPRSNVFVGEVEAEDVGGVEGVRVLYGHGVEPGYFRVAGQRILEGRDFTREEHREGGPVVVLGESAAGRIFPDGSAVGRRIRQGGSDWTTVVGVVEDAALQGLSRPKPDLQMYEPLDFGGGWLLARTTGATDGLLDSMRREVIAAEPDAVIMELAPVDGMLRATLGRENFTTLLLGGFALLALALAAVGLYGVASQLVGQRTREIGIRMSLGARTSSIRGMVLLQGLGATAVGVLIGGGLALVGIRLLQSQVFGLERAEPTVYVAAAAVLGAVMLAACWVPAGRAAAVDPSEALRSG